MQKSNTAKKKPKIVTKPILTGRITDSFTIKRALRVTGSIVVAVFLYMVFGVLMMFDNMILRLLANTALVLLGAGFLYMSGATQGEADAAYGEIMYQRREEGKEVPDSEIARSFHPSKGIATAFIGALPFVLLAIIVAVTTQLQTYSLGTLPDWISAYRQQTELGEPLRYYDSTTSFGVLDAINLLVRFVILPYVGMVGSSNAQAVLLVERLSPLLVLIVPAGYAIGYFRGKDLRARVHTSIAQSKRRKKKKDKKERQNRQQKGPEQLI